MVGAVSAAQKDPLDRSELDNKNTKAALRANGIASSQIANTALAKVEVEQDLNITEGPLKVLAIAAIKGTAVSKERVFSGIAA